MSAQLVIRNVVNRTYLVPITGCQSGVREYEFRVDSTFFDEFGEADIDDADVDIKTILKNDGSAIRVSNEIKGRVTVKCDRCLDPLSLNIERSVELVVRFVDNEEEEADADEILLNHAEKELDMKQFFYDYICLSLPIRKVHEEGECNQSMLAKMIDLGV